MSHPVPRPYLDAVEAAPAGVDAGIRMAHPAADEIVVFLIGMRVNRWRRVSTWWPVFAAMPRMLKELEAADRGLLGARSYWSGRVLLVVQYWRSARELGAFARDASAGHAPAWRLFNRDAAGTGDVGIFHETYLVPRSGIESRYGNMPLFGLRAAVGAAGPVTAAAPTRAQVEVSGLGSGEPGQAR